MLWIKKNKIIIDAFCSHSGIHNLFPIKRLENFIPKWLKNMPSKIDKDFYEISTIKQCVGLNDYYKKGFAIPLWCDLALNTFNTGHWNWQWSDSNAPWYIAEHEKRVMGDAFIDVIHMKIMSPWLFKEKTGVKFFWSQPSWTDISDFSYKVLPAVIDYKYQNITHINIVLPKKDNKILIEAGTPMVHIVPLSDKDVEIRNHLVEDKEMLNISLKNMYSFTFKGKYKKAKSIIDKRCPFK